jgi:hypothetical protein
MDSKILAAAALFCLAACSGAPNNTPDAGPDTSCGIDCAAQNRYGLIVGRCFEYSDTTTASNPASLGAEVQAVEQLEGNVSVLPVQYTQNGQTRMTDYFTIRNGDLYLARREFLPGQSNSYKDDAGVIVGVLWLKTNSAAGETSTTTTQADILTGANRHTDVTTYQVTTAQPTPSELAVPAQSYDGGVKLIMSETPSHGADPRRVFVPDVGFSLFASAFSQAGGNASEYRLQKVRDITASSEACGFGGP